MTHSEFIEQIAKYVRKYAGVYGIAVHSPVIAQAILESGWGDSQLASKYHNYFGLKCGGAWTGKSVNMATSEEYTPGVHTNIRDNFRVFDSMEDGVKGYFEFINYSRYDNLKGVTDPREYVEKIKADGYATSSTYVDNLMRVINDNNLTRFDNDDEPQKDVDIEDYAHRVWHGEFGNGEERKEKLEAIEKGLYWKVQQRVNELYCDKSKEEPKEEPKKELDIDAYAERVIRGDFGNGQERVEKLEAIEKGLYRKVQNRVNEILAN